MIERCCCGLQVILHVDEAVLGKFLQHLLLQNLFGLNASNVMVVPLARFPGQLPVPGTTQTMRAAEANTARALAGPGFAMLSCGWPRYSFVYVLLLPVIRCTIAWSEVTVRHAIVLSAA